MTGAGSEKSYEACLKTVESFGVNDINEDTFSLFRTIGFFVIMVILSYFMYIKFIIVRNIKLVSSPGIANNNRDILNIYHEVIQTMNIVVDAFYISIIQTDET